MAPIGINKIATIKIDKKIHTPNTANLFSTPGALSHISVAQSKKLKIRFINSPFVSYIIT